MTFNEYWDEFSQGEKDSFGRICRILLRSTFIVKEKDEASRRAYFTVTRNEEAFSQYFGYMGFDIYVDKDNGVVMLRNREAGRSVSTSRYSMRKSETVILCCLWTVYADRLRSGLLARTVTVKLADIKFELEKFGYRDKYDNRTDLERAFKLFRDYNLIDTDGQVGDEDFTIIIYPSIQFAMNEDAFGEFVKGASERVAVKTGDAVDFEETDDENS